MRSDDELDVEGHRLATNDNETVVVEDDDVEGHRLSSNDNETRGRRGRRRRGAPALEQRQRDVVVEDDDVEGHRLSSNDNETVVVEDD